MKVYSLTSHCILIRHIPNNGNVMLRGDNETTTMTNGINSEVNVTILETILNRAVDFVKYKVLTK